MDNTESKKLVLQLSAENEEDAKAAMDKLSKTYYDDMYLYAFKIGKVKQDAEDIVQDTLTEIWIKRNSLKITGSLRSYLLGAVKFRCFTLLDKNNKNKKRDNDFYDNNEKIQYPSIPEENELMDKVDEWLKNVSDKRLRSYIMFIREERSYKEIEEETELSKHTIRSQVNYVVKYLKEKFKKK